MKKIIFLLIILILFSGTAFADYDNDVLEIINIMDEERKEFVVDFEKMVYEEISTSDFINKLENKKERSYKNLKEIINLSSEADDQELHADLVSLVSSWHLSLELVENGLMQEELAKVESALDVILFIGQKAQNIAQKNQ